MGNSICCIDREKKNYSNKSNLYLKEKKKLKNKVLINDIIISGSGIIILSSTIIIFSGGSAILFLGIGGSCLCIFHHKTDNLDMKIKFFI